MADEIHVAWLTGKTLTANVFKPDGTVRETGINLTENAFGTLYLGDCTTIQVGDIIVTYEAGVVLGAREYDPIVVEGALNRVEALRLILAALVGKTSGGGTTTITIRNPGDSKDRIIATVDTDGNRTNVVLDAS